MEIDHLLDVSDGQLVTYDNEESLEKVRWWLATPEGQRWGDPGWGNKLVQFKHDPVGASTEVAIEAHIFSKLSVDLPSVSIRGIRVICEGPDSASLTLETTQGLIETVFNRAGG